MNEVGIRLKVAASGLENIQALTKELNGAGVETTALDKKAAELGAELKRLADEQALINAFKAQKAAVAAAAAAMEEAKTKAAALGRELSATTAPTVAQEQAFAKTRTAARDANTAYDAQRVSLQQLRGQMAAAGVSTDGLAAAQVRVNQDAAKAREQINRLEAEYRQVGQAATQSAATQVRASSEVRGGLEDVGRQLNAVRSLAAAAIGGQFLSGMIGDVAKTADAYANLAARIKLVTGEGAAFNTSFQGVFDVATRTNSSLEATGTLFARIAEAGKQIGVSQADALRLTETINQAVQLSGTSAESSNAAITQLIQGLQSGVLRGDEFNSVMEQAPRLAKALGDGLGITTGELRKMADAGTLSSQTVIGALRGQSAALQKEFSLLPATVGRAIQNLSTNWTRYVGEADKASGASSAAAKIIEALAKNLDSIAAALLEGGKAFAAYAALRIADSFNDKARAAKAAAVAIEIETVATVGNTQAAAANTTGKRSNAAAWGELAVAMRAETAALGADTAAQGVNSAATVTNTAAKRATAVAATGAAAGLSSVGTAASAAAAGLGSSGAAAGVTVGRFAAMRVAGLALVTTLGAVGAAVAIAALSWDVFKAAGTWIGETAAKLAGYKDRTEELAIAQKASAAAAKVAADQQAAYAQKTALAAEKALGLTDVSRKLVADFDDLRTKGTSAGDALEKLAKDLDLGTPKGINDAVTALDVLERKGKITGEQVRQALSQALDGKDLGIFEVQARAAFDGSEQGARRLKSAVDAVSTESLRRAGTSVAELQSGFSTTMNSAINDTDALQRTLKALGVTGDAAGQLLAKSIDREIEAANTERALERVKLRLIEMGRTGDQSADQVATGLKKITDKADDAKGGINSVAEAVRKLNIQTRADLQKTADDFKQSWEKIRSSTLVTLEEKIKGFARYLDAAIAANNGVESSELALQRQTLETAAKAAGLGDAFARAMSKADSAIAGTKRQVNELGEEVNAAGERINQMAAGFNRVTDAAKAAEDAALRYGSALKSTKYDADKFALGADGSRFTAGGQLQPPDSSGNWEFVGDARVSGNSFATNRVDVNRQGYWLKKTSASGDSSQPSSVGIPSSAVPLSRPAAAASAVQPSAGSSSTHTVNINLGAGRSTSIAVVSSADAERLKAMLGLLAEASDRAAA